MSPLLKSGPLGKPMTDQDPPGCLGEGYVMIGMWRAVCTALAVMWLGSGKHCVYARVWASSFCVWRRAGDKTLDRISLLSFAVSEVTDAPSTHRKKS